MHSVMALFQVARVLSSSRRIVLQEDSERKPSPIRKSARGEYSVDDEAMHRWCQQYLQQGRWPPPAPRHELDLGEDAQA